MHHKFKEVFAEIAHLYTQKKEVGKTVSKFVTLPTKALLTFFNKSGLYLIESLILECALYLAQMLEKLYKVYYGHPTQLSIQLL